MCVCLHVHTIFHTTCPVGDGLECLETQTCLVTAGAITTLGRGGSDLSATVIGAALGLAEVQVWKDVDGESPCTHLVVCSQPTSGR